ncbi:asparagine synthase (glutamine-hydrolyzing) [Nocardia mangyaensis]|uniref:asparagine synthase (glutamine-hydrolyzing) n=1 Tax=Nocardia mangyaensis TaxID=2213200 RepID=UPI00267505AD|nr:asparagine synthase (glutamine-hydrolyzing) [Nocardia mangyaensis]MDO3645851.1 asparagine synthase (glutamine-hydrolyzing) [Nocardia mangyaensis]
MCGIAGWVDPCGLVRDGERVVAAMAETLSRRGPDGHGVWADSHAALAHRRLAVLDPEHGHQPMVATDDADRTLAALAYTGEVFNHAELRGTLELLGHKFTTRTDTEVVLHACLEWGLDAVHRLHGMFAFAYWDVATRRLLLVRDRLGIKPLCYRTHGEGVRFGSEPKALLVPGPAPAVDTDGLRDFLSCVRTPGRTLLHGIQEVRPGTVLVVDPRGVREHRYWQLESVPHTDELPTTIDTVGGLLDEITTGCLHADVRLGALLSGGLDSSALTALAQRGLDPAGAVLPTFSVDFAGNATDFVPDALRSTPDAPYVRDMAAHCGFDHRDIVLDTAALTDPAVRGAVVAARDLPAAGDLDSSLYLLFEAVREHATVVLSGECADEVFGGYSWFHDPQAIARPDYPWRYFAGRSGTARALLREDVAAELDLTAHRAAHYQQALTEIPTLPGESADQRRMREVLWLHFTHWLPDLLDRKDRLSMAVGLEVRVPFCDHRLIEYAFNIPWQQHTFDGREKSLLRAAVAGLLPHSVTTRTKAPYPITQDPAYDRALREQAADLVANPSAPVWVYLDRNRLRERLQHPRTDRATRSGIDFALNFDIWLDHLTKPTPVTPRFGVTG